MLFSSHLTFDAEFGFQIIKPFSFLIFQDGVADLQKDFTPLMTWLWTAKDQSFSPMRHYKILSPLDVKVNNSIVPHERTLISYDLELGSHGSGYNLIVCNSVLKEKPVC